MWTGATHGEYGRDSSGSGEGTEQTSVEGVRLELSQSLDSTYGGKKWIFTCSRRGGGRSKIQEKFVMSDGYQRAEIMAMKLRLSLRGLRAF